MKPSKKFKYFKQVQEEANKKICLFQDTHKR